MSRKGQFADMMVTIVMVVAIGAVVLFAAIGGVKVFDTLKDRSSAGTLENDIASSGSSKMPNILQGIFLVIFLGMGLVVLISAFLVRNMPVLAVVMLLLMLFVVIYAPAFGNFYDRLSTNEQTYDMAERMPAMIFIFDWYPKIMLGLSFIAAIVMFGKGGGE